MTCQTLTLFLFLTTCFCPSVKGQIPYRVMFYNVENLFDTVDDPLKEDQEFLLTGNRRWTPKRYYHKLHQIVKVIHAAGEWEAPALIGLCEVENDTVLHHLLTRTSLRPLDYRYCITNSQDPRGMNVALLYQRDKFRYLGHTGYSVRFTTKRRRPTRDILHAWGEILSGDTVDILVNHFPSRYGGEKESEKGRADAAHLLKTVTDSLCRVHKTPWILIMGDFNDEPQDKSIREILQACPLPYSSGQVSFLELPPDRLYNLIPQKSKPGVTGTHKYQGGWTQLDQIIINGSFLQPTAPVQRVPESCRIFAPDFLFIPDKTWKGVRPKRTFHGFRYEGGYSDHLPVITDFLVYLSSQP
ncbi:MAG: endonuclease [Tannerellaceae bacterium]|nr:endonuclease [Tannerellaceae bacterium]